MATHQSDAVLGSVSQILATGTLGGIYRNLAILETTSSLYASARITKALGGVGEIVSRSSLFGEATIKTGHDGLAILDSVSSFVAYGQLTDDYLSVREVVNEVLMLWGIEDANLAKEFLRQQAINEINASMQFVASQAKGLDYLGRTTRSYSLTEHQSSVTLEKDVQNVVGPVRWNRPAVAVEILNSSNPSSWVVDLGRMETGYFTLTLNVGGVATAYTARVKEPDGSDPFTRHFLANDQTPGAFTNNTGRLDQSLDIPEMLSTFEGNSNVSPGDLMITGSWPRYKIELTGTGSLAVSNIPWTALTSPGSGYSPTLRSESTPLRPLSTLGQLESWRQTTGAYQTGRPEYYYVSRKRTGEAEGTSIALEIRPHPDMGSDAEVGSLSVDVALEPPRFSWTDFNQSSAVPLPHKYVESLFLPIARYRAMVSQYYVGTQEASASIQSGYQSALAQFGMVDPQIKEAEETIA